MAKKTISVNSGQEAVSFENGSVLRLPADTRAVTQFTNDGGGLRPAQLPADMDSSAMFDRALAELGIHEQETIHLDVVLPPAKLRSRTPLVDDTAVLSPAPSPFGGKQVVLYQDESGGLSWHFRQSNTPRENATDTTRSGLLGARAQASGDFVIPLRTPAGQRSFQASTGSRAARGIITKVGRKVLKVLVIPAAAALLGEPAESIVGAIERRFRQNLLWTPTPDTYAKTPTPEVVDWTRFASGPALLLVHGIFSSVEGMLSNLPRSAMQELYAKYEGRVIAYNHISVTESPEENARWLLEQLKTAAPQGQFTFNVLCHSRGGIVSRALAERGRILFPEANCNFRKVFFVATPNQGSALGDPAHIVDMIDVFTNLLTNFPDGPVMYSIETILAIVKLLAYTAESSLPGLAGMGTQTYIKNVLNAGTTPSPALYGAAGSEYQPDPRVDNGFLTGPFMTRIVDQVFRTQSGDVLNDLVVPEQGVYGRNGHPSFPIADPLVFGKEDRVWHGGFFSRSETMEKIRQFL